MTQPGTVRDHEYADDVLVRIEAKLDRLHKRLDDFERLMTAMGNGPLAKMLLKMTGNGGG